MLDKILKFFNSSFFCIHKWSYWDGIYRIDPGMMKRFRHLDNRLVPRKFRKCDRCKKTQKRNRYNKWISKELDLKDNNKIVSLSIRFLGDKKETKSEKRNRIINDILN